MWVLGEKHILKMQKYVILVLLTSVVFQLILASRNSFLRPKIPQLDLLRSNCHGHENGPFQFQNIRISRHHRANYISGKLIVKPHNFTQLQVILRTKRCISKEALDTCEPLEDVTINKVCIILNQKNQVWTPFVNSMHPPLGCPAKRGTYIISNGTFDVGPLVHFPGAEDWYWKVQAEVYQQDSRILAMCLVMEGHIIDE